MKNELQILPGKPYFAMDGKPFFWLGDTAWLLFSAISREEAFEYLRNRAEKGFNVIQATLVHFLPDKTRGNGLTANGYDIQSEKYWRHIDSIVDKAAELGLIMALLPSWGSIVKSGVLNLENVEKYGRFLADRYRDRTNVIWLLGGDIKAEGYVEYYNKLGHLLKQASPERLIGYHPFGRCSSSLWLNDADWLDFHMFQSGHRRYDQCSMGAWDDTANSMSLYGEDNWRYVLHDRAASARPVLDGEPSYEDIPQGLHDDTQPRWTAKDVRRYAYWSVFAGAAGHTYGNNSVMQFFDPASGKKGSYGAQEYWKDALNRPGAGQMRYLKELMASVDYPTGHIADELLIGGQRERHERVAVFASDDFVFAYSFSGKPFALDVSKYAGKQIYLHDPATGKIVCSGMIDRDTLAVDPASAGVTDSDFVLSIR